MITERTKKIVSAAGTLLMLVSFLFIGIRMVRYDIDFSALASPFVASALMLLACAAGLGYFFAGIVYQTLLESLSGLAVGRRLVVKIYCISNLYKYIPGSVMYAVGRNRLVFETSGLSHSTVALATVVEMGLYALAGFVVAVLFALEYFVAYMRQAGVSGLTWAGATALLLCLLLALFHHANKRRYGKHVGVDFSLAIMPKLLGAHVLILLLQSLTYPATLVLLGQPLTFATALNITGLHALSWLVGFLTPGAPSGLGAREAVMLMFLGGIVDEGVLLSSIVTHRAMGVVGDVFVYVVSLVYFRR